MPPTSAVTNCVRCRDAEGLYMRRSLEWLIDDGVREVIATAEIGADRSGAARAADALPAFARPRGHRLSSRARRRWSMPSSCKSRAAAARCYADPFLPNAQPLSLIDRVMAMLRRPAGAPLEAAAARRVTRPRSRRAARPQPVSARDTAAAAPRPRAARRPVSR